MDFKDLKSLEAYLQKQIKDSLKKEVAQDAKELMKQHIQTDVYDKYSPTQYIRREADGGLLDDDNFLIEEVSDGVLITNVTSDNGYSEEMYGDWSSDPNTWLVPIIEYGTDYNWKNSKIYQMQPYPRPFVEKTQKELDDGKSKEYLSKALKKRGLNVKG